VSQQSSQPALFLKTIHKLPPQPASFYYPVEETQKSQETAPKKILAKNWQGKMDFSCKIRKISPEKLQETPASASF
jgi:hypothetical protein